MSSLTFAGMPRDMGIHIVAFLPPSSRASASVSRDLISIARAVDRAVGQQDPAVMELTQFQDIAGTNSQELDASFETATTNLELKRKERFTSESPNKKQRIDVAQSKAAYLADDEWKDRCVGLLALLHKVIPFKNEWEQIRANTTNCYEVAKAIITWMEANKDKLQAVTSISPEKYRWRDLPDGSRVPKPNLGHMIKVLNCIPRQIQYFSRLRFCNFNHNFLNDLPEEMGTLPIQTLYLHGNCFKKVPAIIAALPHLRELDLSMQTGNGLDLTDQSPLWRAQNLEQLQLCNLHLQTLSTEVKKLTQLKTLDLSHNKDLKEIPPSLAEMSSLRNVFLSGTDIQFPALKKFILHCCQIGRETPLRFKFDSRFVEDKTFDSFAKELQEKFPHVQLTKSALYLCETVITFDPEEIEPTQPLEDLEEPLL